MRGKEEIYNELLEAFMNYQQRLDYPMPSPTESPDAIMLRYRNDPLFHNRVENLASGVMSIVDKYMKVSS
jgi:hypothetical protein